jgi:hypothetical protein
MNDAEKGKLVKSMVSSEKEKIAKFLADNPEIVASDLAGDMVFVGLPEFYVSLIAGVSVEEINRLKNVRH